MNSRVSINVLNNVYVRVLVFNDVIFSLEIHEFVEYIIVQQENMTSFLESSINSIPHTTLEELLHQEIQVDLEGIKTNTKD